ncbi:DUF6157 family protein [Emticicia agri]|uniref:Uncharacterized protein n=1 Tax=Emticicia agri TaxID=2492393 RepID=A0A4V1ZD01_9BACT|nr:DUF6157 family protein [Emticicia agri]RYU94440.1 hypothetical protein EWM59_16710 [Emticicia agri]
MKTHTTNYYDTFIEIATDCPVTNGEVPPVKGDAKTAANIQFDMLIKNPYKYTSDDVLFQVFADKHDLTEAEYEEARKQFFSKGQACLRASPLTKRYGWGVHSNHEGKVALYASNSPEYEKFVNDKGLKVVKAMKSSK